MKIDIIVGKLAAARTSWATVNEETSNNGASWETSEMEEKSPSVANTV